MIFATPQKGRPMATVRHPSAHLVPLTVTNYAEITIGGDDVHQCEKHYSNAMGTLTIRTDPQVERALAMLTSEGKSRSQAARAAILDAERAQRRARLRTEAEDLRNDPDDVAASRELAAEMDAIRAPGRISQPPANQ